MSQTNILFAILRQSKERSCLKILLEKRMNEWCFKAHRQLGSYWAHLHIKH